MSAGINCGSILSASICWLFCFTGCNFLKTNKVKWLKKIQLIILILYLTLSHWFRFWVVTHWLLSDGYGPYTHSNNFQNESLIFRTLKQSLTKKNYTKIYVTYTWNILHIYVSYMYSLCRYMLAICICYIYVELGPTYMWHICKYMGSIWDW